MFITCINWYTKRDSLKYIPENDIWIQRKLSVFRWRQSILNGSLLIYLDHDSFIYGY